MNLIKVVLISSIIVQLGAWGLGTILESLGEQLRNFRLTINGPSIQTSLMDKDIEEYDFVVVGAGSAGCVLAARLSENPNWRILLIEAGPSESPLGQIPNTGTLLVTTQHGWTYKSSPQNYSCFGRPNNECVLRTGRGLGGGSSINGVIYARGGAYDFDEWAARGNPGWSYQDVLPYFKKSEEVRLKHFDAYYHGHDGPLTIEDYGELTPETAAFLSAGNELGYERIDYHGEKFEGVSDTQFITQNGRRLSTSKAYLEPIRHRKNLIIKTDSHAMNILFDRDGNARGIIYRRKNRYLVALNNKELIISCGALNSPQLLMASGVGPAEHLASLEIPVVKDLKVGYNLLDHFNFVGINYYYDTTQADSTVKDGIDWLLYGKGPFRSGYGNAIAYLKTNPDLPSSNIELDLIAATFSQGAHILNIVTNMDQSVYDSVWKSHEGKKGVTFALLLTKPKSVGRIKLSSNNTLIQPVINLNYLSQEEDIETLLTGIRLALRFGHTASFKNLGLKLNTLKVAGCQQHPFDSDQYWICAMRILHTSSYHYHGTCKMGPSYDPEAVVDNELRVHGVNGLRVVDASVIPVSVAGHLEAAAVMIGEKGSDIIKNYWDNH